MSARTVKQYVAALWFVTLAFISLSAHADCFDHAATAEGVSARLLRAIAHVESNSNPRAIRHNRNGSIDIGIMQINTVHMPELNKRGIHRRDLLNSCKNIYTAAWLLRRNLNAHQSLWTAVGNYHSATPKFHREYLHLVWAELTRERAHQAYAAALLAMQ
ncbi:lytic transglycosylase domain-containing protein [Paraburkholderia sp. BCC1886]|uniref:lytic transglycosylase domain-containing protein n=1 Tax=Paraburkholderia sp. BCC1886 TaxID=2562670 RepID=UPI001182E2C6|nr:lytic transglycosylase domain-containing protein [Paraburkholderia sp. BCC1886]